MHEVNSNRSSICTFSIIQNDCETLKAIALQIQDPVIGPCITPYMALFCRSTQEYLGVVLLSDELDSEVSDIRNSIKCYAVKYGRSRQRVLRNDRLQDEEFREQLRFRFLKKLNVHYNLGVFFDDDCHPVGNTQQFSDLLSLNGLSDTEKRTKTLRLAYSLGAIIGGVSTSLAQKLPVPSIAIHSSVPSFFYSDQNTNRSTFFNSKYDKDVNLYLLHVLCNIGFVKYVLERIVSNTNPWILRIKYIVTYYSLFALRKLKAHIENNHSHVYNSLIQEISLLESEGATLFISKFRNCMMHYDFSSDGQFVISDDNFDEKKNLFGLVEECFDGKSYEQLYKDLSSLSDKLEELIRRQFDFQKLKLKNLSGG